MAKSCIGDGYGVTPLNPNLRSTWRMLLDLKSLEKKDIIITPEKWYITIKIELCIRQIIG